ncbi:efflux RND transporter permease subunit [Acidiphilium sp. PA]|jgi:CzcA family heavy metal efflux pump|uniref:efflux RND transporter permease subunit n=1 Tax=Acidiphilium sp. PA TaxID=2871705 RepID=UPI0022446393|nr:efflux RND transporter permease subunit [Acidiphilium sp. PA]MCW8309293.1 efflux RND transporter permease subunit [Acidiphilium sp. PA]
MLQSIVNVCLRHRIPVTILVALFVIFAAFRLRTAQYGVFPEFIPPTVTIQTQAPGLDPKQVEALVTDRLELALGGLPGLAKTQSQSQAGLSVVKVVFHGGTNIYRDRELVAGAIASVAASLPARVTPVVTPLQSSTGTVMVLGLQSSRMSLMKLTALMQSVIRPALLNVPGVAQVVGFGSAPEQLMIEAEPARLIAAHLGLNSVATAARDGSAVLGGGWINTGNQQLVIDTHAQVRGVTDLASSVIAHRSGIPITLGDIARLHRAPPPRYGTALVHGKPGIVLVIGTLYGANTLAVTTALHQALARLAPTLHDQGVHVVNAMQVSSFIHTALHQVVLDLAIGAGLILIVLLLVLRNWRVTLISFVSIPVSLLMATELLRLLGVTLNVMALAGLAIALGAVVDDAVVDAENIYRRLRENRALQRPEPAFDVILHASVEVRSAIIYATLAVVIVFIPILLLGGVSGRIFAPLGIAYIAAILSSLVVALTLTPALAGLMLTGKGVSDREPGPIRTAHRLYSGVLAQVNRRFGLFIAVVVLLFGAAAASVAGFGVSFLPQFNARQVIMHFQTAPGTSIDTMIAIGKQVFTKLDHEKSVKAVVMHIGRANLGNGHPGTNKAEIDMTLSRGASSHVAATAQQLLDAIRGAPGTRFWVNTFLAERLHEGLSGFTAPLIVTVYGPHMKALGHDAERIATLLRGLKGHGAITLEAPPNTASITIRARRHAMRRDGVTARALLQTVAAAYAGETVGQVYRGVRIVPIVLTLPARFRHDPNSLVSLPIATTTGSIIPLGSVARITDTESPQLILHDGGRRVQVISVAIASGHSAAFLASAKRAMAKFHFSQGDYVTYGGTAVSAGSARNKLLAYSAIALITILCLLGVALQRGRAVALLALSLPFALIGGIAAVWLTGPANVSLGGMVGFVTLFGIALRNGLMLMIHYGRLVRDHGQRWDAATVRQGAMDRLPAILITALVTALGLLPLALSAGTTGDEIEGPMAIVILGGLISATILTLLLLPSLAGRFVKFESAQDRS